MPSALPDGEPAPADGRLPDSAVTAVGTRPFGIYVHVPYCASRCGYCDFNTYTAAEIGPGASQRDYASQAVAEVRLARRVLGEADVEVETVFFGGGTPTLLPAEDLAGVLRAIASEFRLAPEAEVTTEANPESVWPAKLEQLRAAGFNRVSFGMQSAREHVLAVLDRQHTPGRAVEAVAEARRAGFDDVSIDLIYGTPGESDDDWRASLATALAAGVDHVSAYSLIVEPGTRLAARVARGELPAPDDDVLADRYLLAEQALVAAGMSWYEVSNWSTSAETRCRHNLLYWTSGDWWGIGPGAHSHVGGTRWWNVKHPAAYAEWIAQRRSPAHAREVLTDEDRRLEHLLLGIRLSCGVDLATLAAGARAQARRMATDGLLDRTAMAGGRAVLTLRGRLLADAVVRDLAG